MVSRIMQVTIFIFFSYYHQRISLIRVWLSYCVCLDVEKMWLEYDFDNIEIQSVVDKISEK